MKRSREKIVPRLQLFKPSPALSIDRSGNRRLGHQNSLRLLPARELHTPSLGSCQSCRTRVPSISSAPGGHVSDILHAAPYTVFVRLHATRSFATLRYSPQPSPIQGEHERGYDSRRVYNKPETLHFQRRNLVDES